MSTDDVKPVLDWREIASRVATETDPHKVVALAKDLIRALDENSNRRLEHVTAESKVSQPDAA